jgi:hypothetical protein
MLKGRSVEIDLDKLFAEYTKKKRKLDEEYERAYLELKDKLMRANIEGGSSSRDLRRKNPTTGRKRYPIDKPLQRERADMADPKERDD